MTLVRDEREEKVGELRARIEAGEDVVLELSEGDPVVVPEPGTLLEALGAQGVSRRYVVSGEDPVAVLLWREM